MNFIYMFVTYLPLPRTTRRNSTQVLFNKPLDFPTRTPPKTQTQPLTTPPPENLSLGLKGALQLLVNRYG